MAFCQKLVSRLMSRHLRRPFPAPRVVAYLRSVVARYGRDGGVAEACAALLASISGHDGVLDQRVFSDLVVELAHTASRQPVQVAAATHLVQAMHRSISAYHEGGSAAGGLPSWDEEAAASVATDLMRVMVRHRDEQARRSFEQVTAALADRFPASMPIALVAAGASCWVAEMGAGEDALEARAHGLEVLLERFPSSSLIAVFLARVMACMARQTACHERAKDAALRVWALYEERGGLKLGMAMMRTIAILAERDPEVFSRRLLADAGEALMKRFPEADDIRDHLCWTWSAASDVADSIEEYEGIERRVRELWRVRPTRANAAMAHAWVIVHGGRWHPGFEERCDRAHRIGQLCDIDGLAQKCAAPLAFAWLQAAEAASDEAESRRCVANIAEVAMRNADNEDVAVAYARAIVEWATRWTWVVDRDECRNRLLRLARDFGRNGSIRECLAELDGTGGTWAADGTT